MLLERIDEGQVGSIEDLGEDPPEIADGLVVVDRKRERDATGHESGRGSSEGAGQPASVTIFVGALTGTGTPAAGRYSRSVYSWSMRVVENRQSVEPIDRRAMSSQRFGSLLESRS